jgi:DNA-binding SARP family transcriptional activator/tetratricopeptide (TPR) repeat protein
MAPSFRLCTLGSPQLLTTSGEQVRFRTRKHFALLIRLALEAGHRLTRDYLIDLLWSEAPARLGRHSLAQGISVLKAKLGREFIQVQKATVALTEAAVEVDAHCLDNGQVEINGRFLDGFEIPAARPFEDWKDQWSAKLMPRARDCLVRHMDAGRRIGDYAAVERHAQVLYELDPLSEDATRGLMEARAWVGDRSTALKLFGRYEQRLAEELGAKPSADLVRVADLLREGRRSPTRPLAVAEAAPMQRRFQPETLIGREQEFGALYDAWCEVRRREPRVVVVTGDPGLGKTTLTNTFAASCQMDGAVIARAQAYEAERDLPFAVLSELVKQLVQQRAVGGADPEALGELMRICSEVGQAYPGVPKPVDWSPEVVPLRLADAFLKTVTAAAEESPVVVVVDDLHAADNATAGILHVLARKLTASRVLMLLTARPAELRVTVAPAALASDQTIKTLRQLELEPLAPAESKILIKALASGASRSAIPVDRILNASRGNPLAIELLVREWLSHGERSLLGEIDALDTEPTPTIGIPRAITDVFKRNASRIDSEARAALNLAAILGRRLSDFGFYDLAGLSAGQATEALTCLRDEGFLRDSGGDLEFRNELLRAQAYYTLPSRLRQQYHKHVAERLAALPDPTEWALQLEIAGHFARAQEVEKATQYALEGAEQALGFGAAHEVERTIRSILNFAHDRQTAAKVRLILGQALLDQSKGLEARIVVEPLTWDSQLTLHQEAQVAYQLALAARLSNTEGDLRASTLAELSVDLARQAGDQQLTARTVYLLIRSANDANDAPRMARAERELSLLTRQEPDDPTVRFSLGYCHAANCDVPRAIPQIERALTLPRAFKDPSLRVAILNGLGVCKYWVCDWAGSTAALTQALHLANRIGDDKQKSMVLGNMSNGSTVRGRPEEAIRCAEEATGLARYATESPFSNLSVYFNLADAYLLLARRSEAEACFEEIKRRVDLEGKWYLHVVFLIESSCLALALGNVQLALSQIALVEEMVGERKFGVPNRGVYEKLRVYRIGKIGDPTEALAVATRAAREFRGKNHIYYLDALAAQSWAEALCFDAISEETEQELASFERLGANGKRRLLELQGFLNPKAVKHPGKDRMVLHNQS